MLRSLLWLLLCVSLTARAEAGPWARAEGGVFLSFAQQRDRDGNSETSLYSEYGLTPRKTLGLELSHTNLGETTGLVWMQQTLDKGEGPHRLAVAAGVGVVERDGIYTPLGQIRAGWGRGIERLPGGGWLTAEASLRVTGELESSLSWQGSTLIENSYLTPQKASKAELTLGFRPKESLMVINQLRFEQRDDTGFSGSLAISSVYDLPGPAKIELGVIAPMAGAVEQAIKLGTWFEF